MLFLNLQLTYAANENADMQEGEFSSLPRLLLYSPPVYPPDAERYNLSGRVSVKVKVLNDGSVGNIAISHSSGYRLLDQAVLDVAKSWKYATAIDKNGVPRQIYVLHTFSFGQPGIYAKVKSVIDAWDPERLDPYSNPAVYNYHINQIYTPVIQFEFKNIDASYQNLVSSIEAMDEKKKYDTIVYRAIARKIIKEAYPLKDEGLQWYQHAQEWESKSKFEEAILDYDKAILVEPYDADYYGSRAFAQSWINKDAEAIRDYGKAIELDPNNYKNYNSRGFVYCIAKEYANAIRDYNKAIELKSDESDNFRGRGYVFKTMKEYGKAIADYSNAIEINSDNYRNYEERGKVYFIVKKYQEAVRDYHMAIQIAPNAPLIEGMYYNLGEAYLELRDYRNALDSYNTAIAKSSSVVADYYNGRGKAYLNLKEYQKAIDDFSQAIENLSDNSRTYEQKAAYYANRAEVYQKLGMHDEAVKDKEKANKLKLGKD